MNRPNDSHVPGDGPTAQVEKRRELYLFLAVTLIVFPLLAVAIVGGYGFAVWVLQMIAGPPGPAAG